MTASLTSAGPVIVEIRNQRGLHARASAKFVRTAGQYSASVTVCKDGAEVPGTSIMGLMMLAAALGDCIEIRAEGDDAEPAIQALCQLVAEKFGED